MFLVKLVIALVVVMQIAFVAVDHVQANAGLNAIGSYATHLNQAEDK